MYCKGLVFKCLIIIGIAAFAFACERNHAPVVTGINCSPDIRSAGTLFSLRSTTADEDYDILKYRWSADGGVFADSVNDWQTKWRSPIDGNGKTFTIRLTVSDGKEESFMDYQIKLTEPVFGDVSGYAYFSNCEVPVPGVTVSADAKTAVTDSSGFFTIRGIPVGSCTLRAEKDGYSSAELTVTVIKSVNLKVNLSMLSALYTSRVSGTVKGSDSLPVSGATVTMLNPDLTESQITATTNAAGFYKLYYVPLGQRKILARKLQTLEFGFEEVLQTVSLNVPDYGLDIEMKKFNLVGILFDRRDNHQYGYKVYGAQTWMTDNLTWLPAVSPPKDGSDNVPYYYVYGYEGDNTAEAQATTNFSEYGVLYNWTAAGNACPAGWHLPSDVEWKIFENYLGSDAGIRLKSLYGWANRGNGNNLTGFNALPGGERQEIAGFTGITEIGEFWSNTTLLGHGAWTRSLYYSDNLVHRQTNALKSALSVRCLKN